MTFPIAISHGPLAEKVARNAFAFHLCEENLICGISEIQMGALLATNANFRSKKTCQIPRKSVICDYLLLNCILQQRGQKTLHIITPSVRRAWRSYKFAAFCFFPFFGCRKLGYRSWVIPLCSILIAILSPCQHDF